MSLGSGVGTDFGVTQSITVFVSANLGIKDTRYMYLE